MAERPAADARGKPTDRDITPYHMPVLERLTEPYEGVLARHPRRSRRDPVPVVDRSRDLGGPRPGRLRQRAATTIRPAIRPRPACCRATVVTQQGREAADLYLPIFIIAVIVFVLVEGILIVAALRFRRKRGDDALPAQTHGHNGLELLWTAIPALVVSALFVVSTSVLLEGRCRERHDPAVTVDVTGFQWQWTFDYNDQGLSFTGTGQDGPEMVVPVDETIHIRLHAHGRDPLLLCAPVLPQAGRRARTHQRVPGHRGRRRARTAASAPSSAGSPTPTCTSRCAPSTARRSTSGWPRSRPRRPRHRLRRRAVGRVSLPRPRSRSAPSTTSPSSRRP